MTGMRVCPDEIICNFARTVQRFFEMGNPLFWFFVAAVAAVILSIVLTRVIVRSRLAARYGPESVRKDEMIARLQDEKAGLSDEVKALKDSIPGQVQDAVRAANAAKDEVIRARDAAHEEAMRALKEQLAESLSQMKAQTREATEELLRQRQQEFKDASSTAIGDILAPMKEKMEELRKEMSANSDVHKAAGAAIKGDVETLMKYTGRVARSTDQLAAAFKYGNKIQGTWGETILEELLSSQGLTRGVHFDVQPTLSDASGRAVHAADGAALRPDVIIHLDRTREVIVDAKTSLTDYVAYVNAENEEDRARHLRAHIESVRKHVKELARKDYAAYVQPPKVSAGYVIMFVPNMGALWTALNEEPDLWRQAAEQNVYIADEQSLYGALRIVQLTWTQVLQAENHEKVYALADEMVDRVDKFLEGYEAVGEAIEKTQRIYTDSRKKLLPGGQSIVTTARKLSALGAKQNKAIDRAALDDEAV